MLIFLNTQTTGLQESDKICSVGIVYLVDGELLQSYQLLNEGKKISSKASSINHITDEMIKDKPEFINSDIFKILQNYNNQDTIIVGHNIEFHMKKLALSGFNFKGSVIDTLRVTKHLIKECDEYSLQYLRYELKLYKDEEDDIVAHNALGDAKVTRLLYQYLLDISDTQRMCELTFENILLDKFKFGKYAGEYIQDVVERDHSYTNWLLNMVPDLDDDLRYTIDYYLKG
jgi:DNA polymerase-3 subunit epsilon/exodeoxyribonuclease X